LCENFNKTARHFSPFSPNFYEPVVGFAVNCMSSAISTFKTVSNGGLNSPLNDL
jgi:hypothetical protein